MQNLIDKLRKYFEKRGDVAFGFLFGSTAKGYATSLSDIDVAVYFYPKRRKPLEYEELGYRSTKHHQDTKNTKIIDFRL